MLADVRICRHKQFAAFAILCFIPCFGDAAVAFALHVISECKRISPKSCFCPPADVGMWMSLPVHLGASACCPQRFEVLTQVLLSQMCLLRAPASVVQVLPAREIAGRTSVRAIVAQIVVRRLCRQAVGPVDACCCHEFSMPVSNLRCR